ncbi:hypothetical protein FHS56_002085 [Thermonema lapsum]|uniref:Uncharacterized protein n=1 Tax=Thermonema lapsum TaxID=28195 RepID=A0A846MTD1_9BACT|nr:hypothetical protein [Thermonema lapsum]
MLPLPYGKINFYVLQQAYFFLQKKQKGFTAAKPFIE